MADIADGRDNEGIQRIAFSATAAVTLVGVFSPWLQSGAARRSSFELLDLVERLGFAPDGLFAWAVRAWPLVPLLLVAAVVASWAGRATASAAMGTAAGVYVAGVALGVRSAPDAGLITTTWGVDVSLVGAALLAVVSIWIAARALLARPEVALDEDVT